MPKPKLAVVKFASCDGCQLSILDCPELFELARVSQISSFPEASSTREAGPYDITLVEGSISTPQAAIHIRRVRAQTKLLVSLGACATAGGIQALRNFSSASEYAAYVYPTPEYLQSLEGASPLVDHVGVDFELRGCPIDSHQLVAALTSLLRGDVPRMSGDCVCTDCKRRGLTCLTVARGTPCLGPVTQTGCRALCPSYGRGCYGCFGPSEGACTRTLNQRLLQLGQSPDEIARTLRFLNPTAFDAEELPDVQNDSR